MCSNAPTGLAATRDSILGVAQSPPEISSSSAMNISYAAESLATMLLTFREYKLREKSELCGFGPAQAT